MTDPHDDAPAGCECCSSPEEHERREREDHEYWMDYFGLRGLDRAARRAQLEAWKPFVRPEGGEE